MALLVDSSVSFAEASITSLATASSALAAGDKTLDEVQQMAAQSSGLLVDQQSSSADQVGSYTSQPRTLTLETASDSILSSSSSGVDHNSGSLEANENFAAPVNTKICTMLGSFILLSAIVGSL